MKKFKWTQDHEDVFLKIIEVLNPPTFVIYGIREKYKRMEWTPAMMQTELDWFLDLQKQKESKQKGIQFFKLLPGQETTLTFFGAPFWLHKIKPGHRPYICSGKNCPFCEILGQQRKVDKQ